MPTKDQKPIMLYMQWRQVLPSEDRFVITEDSVDAVVTQGQDQEYYDRFLERFETRYIEHTHALQLNSEQTHALHEMAKANLRKGASEESIREEMRVMALRALDGKPLVARQEVSTEPFYIVLSVFLVLLLMYLWLAWNEELDWIKPIKRTLISTFGSTDAKVEMLRENWTLEDAVKVYGGMQTEEAMQRMLDTLESSSLVTSDKYGTIITEWVYEIPVSSVIRTMQVATALKEQAFFQQEQYETLAALFLRRFPDTGSASRGVGKQVFLTVLKHCSDGFLTDFYAAQGDLEALPASIQEYLTQRLGGQGARVPRSQAVVASRCAQIAFVL